MIPLLLAVPELPQEQGLVSAAGDAGLHVMRRCVDGADLLAAAATVSSAAVIVSAGLPRLSADLVERLAAPADGSGARRIIGLAASEADARRLSSVGIASVVRLGPTAEATLRALAAGLSDADQATGAGVWSTGCWEPDPPAPASPEVRPPGRIIAVWGAIGSPGRTTVASGVAEALAESGQRVCLVDADTYAPAITLALGIVEESSGLVVACRHADNGSLTDTVLRGCARQVRGTWCILGGLPSAEQWPDLRPAALERVWEACRTTFDVTVVDIGFCLEDDDAAGAWTRRRNGAALSALAAADHVLAVADAGVVGAARVASAWPALRARTGGIGVTLVRNRARGSDRAWREALASCGVAAPVHPVPADPRALAACWRDGRSLGEGARRSRIRAAMQGLAAIAVSG